MNDLEPGKSIKVPITPDLWYEVAHEGWTVRVACHGGLLRLAPNSDGTVSIGCVGAEVDLQPLWDAGKSSANMRSQVVVFDNLSGR